MKLFTDRGYSCGVVERFISHAGIKKDLFGIIDLIGIKDGEIVGIQVCGADFAPHERKILGPRRQEAHRWLLAGGGLVLVGWTPRKSRKPPFRSKFGVRERRFTIEDFSLPAWLD